MLNKDPQSLDVTSAARWPCWRRRPGRCRWFGRAKLVCAICTLNTCLPLAVELFDCAVRASWCRPRSGSPWFGFWLRRARLDWLPLLAVASIPAIVSVQVDLPISPCIHVRSPRHRLLGRDKRMLTKCPRRPQRNGAAANYSWSLPPVVDARMVKDNLARSPLQ